MPRSPSTYSLPPGTTPQVPNTVISSSMFTAFADDVAQTFNTVQPEAYGGTGASTYAQARANLGAAATIDIRGQIFGLTLSNNATDATNDIDIAAGSAVDSTGVVSMLLASSLTKRLDAAWAVGTNQGGRMSAAAIADTTYHVFLIRRPDTGVVDVGFDVSPTAPTLPANYTQFRRIGSIIRSAGAILLFFQNGDYFVLSDTLIEYNSGANRPLAAFTLTGAPAGIVTRPILTYRNLMTSPGDVLAYVAPTLTSTVNLIVRTQVAGGSAVNTFDFISTTTNREIFFQVSVLSGAATIVVNNKGWIDSRGKNG